MKNEENLVVEKRQRTGKWHGNRCSECKKLFTDNIRGGFYNILRKPNYCPNCGAKMEVE